MNFDTRLKHFAMFERKHIVVHHKTVSWHLIGLFLSGAITRKYGNFLSTEWSKSVYFYTKMLFVSIFSTLNRINVHNTLMTVVSSYNQSYFLLMFTVLSCIYIMLHNMIFLKVYTHFFKNNLLNLMCKSFISHFT